MDYLMLLNELKGMIPDEIFLESHKRSREYNIRKFCTIRNGEELKNYDKFVYLLKTLFVFIAEDINYKVYPRTLKFEDFEELKKLFNLGNDIEKNYMVNHLINLLFNAIRYWKVDCDSRFENKNSWDFPDVI